MFKSLRVKERLFPLATWTVSLVFAGFLMGLGGKLIADLPGVEQNVTLESHIDPAARTRMHGDSTTLLQRREAESTQRETAQGALTAAGNKYTQERANFDTWIATRTATSDPAQDPEVIRRTHIVEQLKNEERAAQAVVERHDATLLQITQSLDSLEQAGLQLREAARPAYERELFQNELKVFLIRLLMTAPLLAVAGWLIARKRKSEYWPLARGFVIFAVYVFFFELVPYLPSYGGYVRYAVGIVLTIVASRYVIRAMQRYMAKREQMEQQTDTERRRTMGYEEAIRKMQAGVCPGCERPIAGGLQSPSNFCVHCGLNLFDSCNACGTRKNAFFQYCPTCGVTTAARGATLPEPTIVVAGV